ncbi:MAG: stage II sporulation protein R [Eubacterium sp.]|nr:stage II sporulation protein R [Eubacterium sp.]CDB67168.1 stage II sporulation protein R [Eubacterium sp. CAG:248]
MSSGKSGGYGKKHINKKCDKNNKAGWVFILAATIMLVIAGGRLYSDSEERQLQKGIASNIIRFHVRAESDSKEDQWLKLQVKEAVLAYISPVLSKSQSVDESRQLLYNESENIRDVAAATLRSLGDESDVNVYFENCYFPMKTYGDMTFPPGEYEAFRVDIGEAQGKNWWCVLYPPLCFVDAVYGEVPEESKEELKGVLTEEEYSMVSGENVKFRFKYLKIFNRFIE